MIDIEELERRIHESLKDFLPHDELSSFLSALKDFVTTSLRSGVLDLGVYISLRIRHKNYVHHICHREVAEQIQTVDVKRALNDILSSILLDPSDIEEIVDQTVSMLRDNLIAHTEYSQLIHLLKDKLLWSYLDNPLKKIEIENLNSMNNLFIRPINQFFAKYINIPSVQRGQEFIDILLDSLSESLGCVGVVQVEQLREFKEELSQKCQMTACTHLEQIGIDLFQLATKNRELHFYSYSERKQSCQAAFENHWSLVHHQVTEEFDRLFRIWQIGKQPAAISILTMEFDQIKRSALSNVFDEFSFQAQWNFLINYLDYQEIRVLSLDSVIVRNNLNQLAFWIASHPCLELLMNANLNAYDINKEKKIAAATFIKFVRSLNSEVLNAFLLYKNDPEANPIGSNPAVGNWRPTLFQYDTLVKSGEWFDNALHCAQQIERYQKLNQNLCLFFQSPGAQKILQEKKQELTAPAVSDRKLTEAVTRFFYFTQLERQVQSSRRDDPLPCLKRPRR